MTLLRTLLGLTYHTVVTITCRIHRLLTGFAMEVVSPTE